MGKESRPDKGRFIVCDSLVGSQIRESFQPLEPSKKLIQAFDADATSLECQRCDIGILWRQFKVKLAPVFMDYQYQTLR